jgi:DNA polymerase elongation subunit (family B)
MLVDYEYKNKNLIVSYINENGNIKLKYYPWDNPTKFVTCSKNDPNKNEFFITWDGRSVKEVYARYPNRYSIYNYLDGLNDEEKKLLFEYKEPNIFFVDIENEITDHKPQPELADSAVQSISIVNKNNVMVLGTKTLSMDEIDSIKTDINNYFAKYNVEFNFKFVLCKTEKDLLFNFFSLTSKMAVITGWNFTNYDWVFLVNRAEKLGLDPKISSPTNVLREDYKEKSFVKLPAHRVVVDYMELYEKWDTKVKVKESSSLDFVSEKLLNLKKVNYEGNLKILYRDDYKKFIFYNAVDSILVQKIHEKMKYIDILYGISTLSKIKVLDSFSTLAVTEGILREKLKEQKNIIFCKLDDQDGYIDPNIIQNSSPSVKGGWVKKPFKGMKTWICCYDFASLYPTTMREFNISADSYKGQIMKNKEFSIFNGMKIPIEPTDIITLNGAVFKNEMGVVTQVMGDIYSNRKKYKKEMISANHDIDELTKELETLEEEIRGF